MEYTGFKMWEHTTNVQWVLNWFEALVQEDLDIDELTQHAAKVITEPAEEVLEKTPQKAKKKWISDETMQLIERKWQLKNQRKSSAEYNDLKSEVQIYKTHCGKINKNG